MAEKRYFWLKLYDDFFTSKRIKKLRTIAGGDTYTIIYLKMQLKALKTDGYLYFDGVMSNFAEELALDIDENPDDVKHALIALEDIRAVEYVDASVVKVYRKPKDERNRSDGAYKEWRKSVFERDDYTCQLCGKRGGRLNAHHKKFWCNDVEHRFDVSNGITLCEDCHKEYHRKFGRR